MWTIWTGSAWADNTEAEYWRQLKRTANHCYDRWLVDVTLGGGLEQREYETGQQTAPYGVFRLTVPLYSVEKRMSAQEKKSKYLEHGAEVLKKYSQAAQMQLIQQEKADVLKATVVQDGAQGIDAYFKIREDAVKAQSEVDESQRVLEAFIGQCPE